MKNEYLLQVIETVKKRNPGEPEFHQTVKEVLESIEPVIEAHPEYITSGVMIRSLQERWNRWESARQSVSSITEYISD